MNIEINFGRAELVLAGMVKSGMSREQAVPLALAMEFAAAHPQYAEKFGEFSAANLNKTLAEISGQQVVAPAS